MKIIIGLGNPGQKFENTRHNLGFMVVDAFAEKNDFPGFVLSKKLNSLISEETIGDERVILAKPQTFMNESGRSVKKLVSSVKYLVSSLIVVHDDMDLPLGTIKIVKNRGSAGHKGVESIIKELGKEDFARVRLGVLAATGKPRNPEKFVISNFRREEEETKNKMVEGAVNAIESLLTKGLEKTMNEHNK